MIVDIKNISGAILLSTTPNEGCKRKLTLQKEDYILLKFSLENPIYFKLGTYVECDFGLFEVCDLQSPTFNTDNAGYDYELRLDAHYWKWKNKIFKYTPETSGQEASWSLTAPLDVQASIVLRNLKALGYTYKGQDFDFSIDSTVENKSLLMTYDNTNILDACFEMAKKWDCECWVTDNIIHFGKCEFGDYVNMEIAKNVGEMSRSESQSTYATRIYAFGSTRNIPANYRPVDEAVVVNGVVQKRLMLPEGIPYIDAYPKMSTEEAIEQVVIFDEVYPRRVGTMSDITTKEYTETIENADGTTTEKKWDAYRFKDTGITFSKDYILPGEELTIIFQSGKLNGMVFAVTFDPDGKDEQLWEIVRNEDYGRPLPDEVLIPEDGDTYVLSGWDSTKITELGLVSAAERELKEEAEKYIAKSKIDPNTYNCTMMSDNAYSEDGMHNLYGIGQRVNLINKAYFENGRLSRVIGFEFNLDKPYDSPVYTVGETAAYSRIGELEDKVENLTLKGQVYTGGSGSGVYVIRRNDSTPATDSNVFSALRSLSMFLRKDKPDFTNYLLRLLGGLEVGEAIDSLTAGKGIIADNKGRIQADRMELRSSLTVLRLIINEIQAMAGDFSFSDCGTIEKVELLDDGTYRLTMEKRTDTDWTTLEENDVLCSIVNSLLIGGTDYYTSWFRPVSKNRNDNTLTVVLYPDSEVPGGKNYPPVEGYNVTRKGNAKVPDAGEAPNERAQSWLISSREGRIMFLQNVFKPILEDYNYALTLGRFPNVKMIEKLPIGSTDVGVMAKIGVFEKIYEADRNGTVIPKKVDRGEWSLETAQGDEPYRFVDYETLLENQKVITTLEQHTVYHYGCKWGCLIDKTIEEPQWNSAGWVLLEGDKNYHLEFTSTAGWQFFKNGVNTDIAAVVSYGNRDITNVLMATTGVEVEWLRDTGNIPADNSWKPVYVDGQKHVIRLTSVDMGSEWGLSVRTVKFICRVFIPVGEDMETVENYVGFRI
jgi:hypothetical protein|nr:MAG TPA: tail protein [Caudoviricetes sp.]